MFKRKTYPDCLQLLFKSLAQMYQGMERQGRHHADLPVMTMAEDAQPSMQGEEHAGNALVVENAATEQHEAHEEGEHVDRILAIVQKDRKEKVKFHKI